MRGSKALFTTDEVQKKLQKMSAIWKQHIHAYLIIQMILCVLQINLYLLIV